MKEIERNFEAKQSLFNELKRLPDSELEKLYNSGELKDVKQKWQKELEVKFEAKNEEEDSQLVHFNIENKPFFDKFDIELIEERSRSQGQNSYACGQ